MQVLPGSVRTPGHFLQVWPLRACFLKRRGVLCWLFIIPGRRRGVLRDTSPRLLMKMIQSKSHAPSPVSISTRIIPHQLLSTAIPPLNNTREGSTARAENQV